MESLSAQYAKIDYASLMFGKNTGPQNSKSTDSKIPTVSKNNTNSALFESISYESLQIDYTSKDGDKVQIQYTQAEYYSMQAKELDKGQNRLGNSDNLEKAIGKIRDTVISMKKEILKAFIKANGGEYQDSEAAATEDTDPVAALEAKMPEYWNAENTSQRIVDFATSFYEQFGQGDMEKFLETIKGAIGLGFSQAKEETGEVPDAVAGLTQKTYDLTMKKLDIWAQNIKSSQPNPADVVA